MNSFNPLFSMLLLAALLGLLFAILKAQKQAPNDAEAYLINLVLVVRNGEKYADMIATLTRTSPSHFATARGLGFLLGSIDAQDVESGFLVSHPYQDATVMKDASWQLWRHQTISAEIEPHYLEASHPEQQNSPSAAASHQTDDTLCLVGLVLVAFKLPFPDGDTSNARFALGALQGMIQAVKPDLCHCYYKPLGSERAAWSEAEVLLPQLRAITK